MINFVDKITDEITGLHHYKGESRFADESLAITYPLLKLNIELRNMERDALYNALFEKILPIKQHYIQTFIALREKRAALINNYLSYENLIETIEGPARYVELKAYSDQSALDYDSVLKKYGEHLIDKISSAAEIRKSCYSSGMAICLLLDELAQNWKESFFNNDLYMNC